MTLGLAGCEASISQNHSTFPPHLGAFVGCLIAHECMHHGEIGMILGEYGKELPLEVVWSWNRS
jgi:hypothetical protein